jgi:hypothetical protein
MVGEVSDGEMVWIKCKFSRDSRPEFRSPKTGTVTTTGTIQFSEACPGRFRKDQKNSDVPSRTCMRTMNAIIFIEIKVDNVAPGASGEIDKWNELECIITPRSQKRKS